MTAVASKKTTRHKCDEMFCTHCNAIKKKDHECFMKVLQATQKFNVSHFIFL
jgi:hypothetical protein